MTISTFLTSFAAPNASTSREDPTMSNTNPANPNQRLLDQREVLDRLAEGEAIPMDEWDGVVEKCYLCNKFMLEAVYADHGWSCWYMSDEESEVDEWGKE